MELHEFQAKELLQKFGIPMPPFFVAGSVAEVEKIIRDQHLDKAVVKVQVHAGGRGKAGGVKIVHSPDEIIEAAKALLGMKIVNEQTGPDGLVANKILLSPLVSFAKEYYVGITIDRKKAEVSLIVSKAGGVEIEQVAKERPSHIHVEPLFKESPFSEEQFERVAHFLGWQGLIREEGKGKKLIEGLIQAFFDYDATLLEINPLVETKEGHLTAVDMKLSVDDNALFRQPKIAALYDPTQISPQEASAKEFDLAFVNLKGDIGCMVNGAGLAMATMDLIYFKGGKPANFLDVGGGATQEKVSSGFKIILSDPQVKAILINIFGGIMNCATIALALKELLQDKKTKLPIVCRMEGTNVDEAKKILHDFCPGVIACDTFDGAAELVVTLAKG